MTSNITDASQDELINLIYHHLKDNGYQKAAHVLRKHAPKVETEEVKVSLSEIFQKWASSDDGDIPPVPSGVETPELQGPAKRKRTKSKITAPSAGLNPKAPAGIIKTPGSSSKSPQKKKNETGTKPRQRKKSSSEDVLVPPSPVSAPSCMNDSDSDSSLDVDKWRKLLSQISDADREKMDVLTILDESPGNVAARKRRIRKPRPSKKEQNQAENGKSDTQAKKATVKSDDISVTTNASKARSKKPKDKDPEVSKVKAPSKKTGNKKNSSISSLDVVETQKRTKAKKNNSNDQDETDKAEEHHETNRLLERTEVGVSDSEAIGTPKRVHFEPNNSFAQQVETPKTANARKGNGTSETSSTDTPSKKAKKKKGQSEATDVETVNSLSDIQKVVKEVKQPAVETHSEEPNLTTDPSETPSKKVKNKKSKSVVEPVPKEMPSKKVKAKKTEGLSEIDQETTSESVNPDSSSKKAKRKANERLSETLESETPSKKSKAVKETGEVETPSKKPKTLPSDADLLQPLSTNGSSKKRKRKVAADGMEIQHDVPSETPVKNQSQAQTQDDVANGLGNEETSSQELKTPKKRKRKVAADGVEIQHDVPSETPVKNQSQAQTQDNVANGLGNEETSSQERKTPSKKIKKQKREEASDAPATPEAKKDKGKKKNKEDVNAEDALQPPPPEEEAASVPVAVSQKKKKKKKEKEIEEETEEVVPDDPPVSAPVEEVAVHKKKKKSSIKQLSSDSAHGPNST